MEYKLDIDANFASFRGLIERFARVEMINHRKPDWRLEKGWSKGLKGAERFWIDCRDFTPWRYQYEPSTDGEDTVIGIGPSFAPLHFDVHAVNRHRLTVFAVCTREELLGLFRDLLTGFTDTWPETTEQLKRQGFEPARVPESGRASKGKGSRGPNIGTPEKVAKAQLLMDEFNWTQTKACKDVPVDPGTYRKYMRNPDFRDEIHKHMGILRRDGYLDQFRRSQRI